MSVPALQKLLSRNNVFNRRVKGVSRSFFLRVTPFTPWFIIFLFILSPYLLAQNSLPVISRLDSRDTIFRQFISDVEGNRRRIAGVQNRILSQKIEEAASFLTIYRYTTRQGDDLLSVAARCNMPYSALVSLNRITSTSSLTEGTAILLPSYPGLYLPENYESEFEKLLTASRLPNEESLVIKVPSGTGYKSFHFFPGADFTPTERTFFLYSGLRFPLKQFRLTSSYGIRQNPLTGGIVMHQGLDLAAPAGTEVYAVTDGTVTEIGNDPIYGNYIIMTHRNRLTSLYGHLQSVDVILQSEVRSGTLIGRVGSTGQSTGPHLHFELRQDGRPVDPSGRLRH